MRYTSGELSDPKLQKQIETVNNKKLVINKYGDSELLDEHEYKRFLKGKHESYPKRG